MKRKLIFVFLTFILLVSVVTYAEEITLRVCWWGSQNRHDRTLQVIELFEEEYPNINVEPEFTGWSGYWEKIAAQTAGKNLPDVFQQDYGYLIQYARKGQLLNLNNYVNSNDLDFSKMSITGMASGELNGNLYGVNLGSNAKAIVYDPAIFAKAGVQEPEVGWTWKDYEDAARKIHDELGIYGSYEDLIDGVPFEIYLRQYGETVYSENGSEIGYQDDQLFVDYINSKVDLVNEGVLPPLAVTAEINAIEDRLITRGEAAMDFIWSNQFIAVQTAANRPLKMALIPKLEDQIQDGLYIKPSQFFSVYSGTKHPEEAVKFIDFFVNNIEAAQILSTDRGIPLNKDVADYLAENVNDTQRQVIQYVSLAADHSSPIDPPAPSQSPEVGDIYQTLCEKVFYGVITPEEAAKTYREEANKILSK